MVSVNLPFSSPTGRNGGPRERPDADADTLIYALAFSRSKLSLCLAAEVATEPGCPHFGPRSAFSKLPASRKLVPSAPRGERLMSEGIWGQSQRRSPSPPVPCLREDGNRNFHQRSPSRQCPARRKHAGHPLVVMETHYPERSFS